ncbi:hypothetical protein E2562_001791 [Oryza meyeriana var. granulata]|uniref:BPM/SPOP BACK domain-containing protein n=1 Tax=Oryza meyeriana var. granulata TaxID=110450 RepID=A0A6G1CEV5_9ORYZ|nr:hypothetical protein E2562_001791 [Oryza meyeriana var. granulata]
MALATETGPSWVGGGLQTTWLRSELGTRPPAGVSVDTVATTLVYAEMHACPELKKRCLDFFVRDKNFEEVASADCFVEIKVHGYNSDV